MQREHLLNLREVEQDYWWHTNKRMLVRAQLARYAPGKGRLLEVGPGGGFFAQQLENAGWHVTVSDVSPEAAAFCRKRGLQRAVVFNAARPWPVANGVFDALLMLDVVEHIEDHGACLEEAARVLRPRGIGVITVPAHPRLFSAWDQMAGHVRRYRKGELQRLATGAGLRLLRLTYWNAVSLPAAAILRRPGRGVPARENRAEFPRVHPWLNGALKLWGRVETALAHLIPLPLGLSLLAVVEKRGADGT